MSCTASDQCHVAGTCNPATGACSDPVAPNGTGCSDGNPCTQTDTCQGGTCLGANPVFCVESDQCHDAGVCQPANGQCTNPPKTDGTACDDGNTCTTGDACGAGNCVGTAGTVPETVSAVSASKTGSTVNVAWAPTAGALVYDVLRGRVLDWPVGSNPATETCLADGLVGTGISDATPLSPGGGYWYLVRAENDCGDGSWGSRASHGVPTDPRLSSTCP